MVRAIGPECGRVRRKGQVSDYAGIVRKHRSAEGLAGGDELASGRPTPGRWDLGCGSFSGLQVLAEWTRVSAGLEVFGGSANAMRPLLLGILDCAAQVRSQIPHWAKAVCSRQYNPQGMRLRAWHAIGIGECERPTNHPGLTFGAEVDLLLNSRTPPHQSNPPHQSKTNVERYGMETSRMKIVYVITDRNDRKYWNRIGVAFTNADGSVNVKLEAIPVTGEMQIREYVPRDEAGRRSQVAAAPALM